MLKLNYISRNFIKFLSENKPIICALLKLQYQIPREKVEPELGFKLWTSISLAWRSKVQILVQVQIFLLKSVTLNEVKRNYGRLFKEYDRDTNTYVSLLI